MQNTDSGFVDSLLSVVNGYPESRVWGTPGRALDDLSESSWKSRGSGGCFLYRHIGCETGKFHLIRYSGKLL